MTASTLPAMLSMLTLETAGTTAIGGRENNEDAILVRDLAGTPADPGDGGQAVLVAVADGMGGHAGGEVASAMAIDTLVQTVIDTRVTDAAQLLKQAFRKANEAIATAGADGSGAPGMGTTLTAALLLGKYATIASVGDSRAYLVRENRLTQITKDHTVVADQLAVKAITPEQAKTHPQRNILTHALGTRPKLESSLPGIFEVALLPGDRLLLCTDGFFDVLESEDYTTALVSADPAHAAASLVQLATDRGTTDNVSAVVVAAIPTRAPVADLSAVPPRQQRGAMVGIAAALVAILIVALLVAVLLGVVG